MLWFGGIWGKFAKCANLSSYAKIDAGTASSKEAIWDEFSEQYLNNIKHKKALYLMPN